MQVQSFEVADLFRDHGATWRAANKGHLSLNQMKVMSAIERCRTAALGGHVARCEDCDHEHIAYNSCRNRHCPKCQSGAAKAWLAAREAELLPVRYFHLVFTLPKPIADIAYQNKREIYNLLMRASADTVIKIAADPKHLGARAGMISVLHTWGSAMTHHPHVHMIVPGGGLSADGTKWIACRKNFFLSVRVLSRLYRRFILEGLAKLHTAGKLLFFGDLAKLVDCDAFDTFLQPLRKIDWVVYAKEPFAGPKAVLCQSRRKKGQFPGVILVSSIGSYLRLGACAFHIADACQGALAIGQHFSIYRLDFSFGLCGSGAGGSFHRSSPGYARDGSGGPEWHLSGVLIRRSRSIRRMAGWTL